MDRITERGFQFTREYVKSNLQSWSIAQALRKLQEYEDKQEDGLLHEAKLKDGTPIWYCLRGVDGDMNLEKTVYIYNVTEYQIGELGKDFWLTEAEAEEALKRRGGDNNETN